MAITAIAIFCVTPRGELPLRFLRDVPLGGGATRFDHQSLDSASGRLYIAHLGADLMTVFDTNTGKVIGDVKDLKRVHGVLAMPESPRLQGMIMINRYNIRVIIGPDGGMGNRSGG